MTHEMILYIVAPKTISINYVPCCSTFAQNTYNEEREKKRQQHNDAQKKVLNNNVSLAAICMYFTFSLWWINSIFWQNNKTWMQTTTNQDDSIQNGDTEKFDTEIELEKELSLAIVFHIEENSREEER